MKLHIFPGSPPARKTLFTNAHLGLDAEIVTVDLFAGDQKHEAFLGLNPNGKVPVLEMDDGSTLWESNAIVNRLAAEADSGIWPKSNQRYDIMRWQFWEAGHWAPACAKFVGKHFFQREIDEDAATDELRRFAQVLDDHLAGNGWLSGEAMTTADISVSAMLCYREACQYPMDGFDNIARWLDRIEALPAWQTANPVPEAA